MVLSTDQQIGRKVPLRSSGLVRELAEFMLEGVQTHPDWCESLATALVGMMIGKDRYVRNNLGKIRGNLFFIYVGASGLSFKTIPLVKVVRPILDKLTTAINVDVLREEGITVEELRASLAKLGKLTAKEKQTVEWRREKDRLTEIQTRLVDFNTIQVFTSEMLTTFLKDYPQGMICGDEYTKMFKGANKKDYLTDNMEDLSRLYDCDMEKKGTISRGVEYPKDAYIGFSSATTYYLLKLMTDDFFLQGTGNRIMWILDDELEQIDVEKEAQKGEFFWEPEREEKFNAKMDILVGKLMSIKYLPTGLYMPDVVAAANLDRYRLNMYNEAVLLFNEDLLNKDANLVSRLAQNAMKLAFVHAVGRAASFGFEGVQEYSENPTNRLEITDEDAQWAINKTQRHYVYYQKMWQVASRVREGVEKSYESEHTKVLLFIQKIEGLDPEEKNSYTPPLLDGKRRVVGRMLLQHTGWDSVRMQAIITTMTAAGKIIQKETIQGVGKKVYYTIPDRIRE